MFQSFLEKYEGLREHSNNLERYFDGEKVDFGLKFGSERFQDRVLEAVYNIPYGETRSYKEIAKIAGNEKASRAVGNIMNRNCLPVVIPCHRVVRSDGGLGGYALGLEVKKKLLKLEGFIKQSCLI